MDGDSEEDFGLAVAWLEYLFEACPREQPGPPFDFFGEVLGQVVGK